MWFRRRPRDAGLPVLTVLLPQPLRSEVVRLRDEGEEVEAVRLVRRRTDLGLLPAYKAVMAAQHELSEQA